MAATIHPDLELHLSLEKDHYEGDIESETERRFSELAPTEVERARASSQHEDVLEFSVGKDAADESRDPVWHDAFTAWLAETFDQATDLLKRENEARRNDGRPELSVARIEVRFGDGPAISLKLEDEAIPPEAAGFVERARELLAEHAFGEDVSRVSIPGCAIGDSVASERAAAVEDDTAVAPYAVGGPCAEDGGSFANDADVEAGQSSGSGAADGMGASSDPARDADEAMRRNAIRRAYAAADAAEPDTLGGPGFASDERKRDEPTQEEIEAAVQEAEEALRTGSQEGSDGLQDASMPRSHGVPSVRTEDAPPSLDQESPACTPDARIWEVDYADGTHLRYDSVLVEVVPVRW